MIDAVEPFFITGSLALLGLMFGSFAGAQVWRIRARQLRGDEQRLSELNTQENLTDDEEQEKSWLVGEAESRRKEHQKVDGLIVPLSQDHSRCLHCHHRLRWYDLLPIVSWASTRGRCRYCQVPIGYFEPAIELGVAAVFVASYLLWPVPLGHYSSLALFILWLIALVLLAILFAYDFKWFLLPDKIVVPLFGIGILVSIVRVWQAPNSLQALISLGGAILILSGLYYMLYHIPHKELVGFGDVKLGLGLALLLTDWRLALVALFSANLIGSLIVVPFMLAGRIDRKAHVPFGPLLIAGTVLAMLFGSQIVAWYESVAF